MDFKKITIIVFVLTCLAQIYVPLKMILGQEDVLKTGVEYKFRTAPVDPNDPLRGKYIVLDFSDNSVLINGQEVWSGDIDIYVHLTTDSLGFAKIKEVSKIAPEGIDYVAAKSWYQTTTKEGTKLVIDYPFDRFYMEEFKAGPAERIFRDSNRENESIAYALVAVKNGQSVLKDVIIDGISIKEWVEKGGE